MDGGLLFRLRDCFAVVAIQPISDALTVDAIVSQIAIHFDFKLAPWLSGLDSDCVNRIL